MKKDSNWYKGMLAKYGSDEAISAAMRENAKNSPRNKGGTPYFKRLKEENPELLREISKRHNTKGLYELWQDQHVEDQDPIKG